jgi:hypothetical protein
VFNATFNNISVEITFIGGENHRPVASHLQAYRFRQIFGLCRLT